MRFVVRGVSVNGLRDYELSVEAKNVNEARRIAREAVTDYVAAEFERTPEGVSFLLNPMYINVQTLNNEKENQS